ncbi:hypothetical protein ACIPVB_02535 [Microbacterium sp. NPDC090007]|uniref:hypothetical protein n=1 Tax=Microbacterium sp. NPDC090007 TaxID=3364204 RepID=UPI0038073EB4
MADSLLDHYDLEKALPGSGLPEDLWSVLVEAYELSADFAGSQMWLEGGVGASKREEALVTIRKTRDAAAEAGDEVLAARLDALAEAVLSTL